MLLLPVPERVESFHLREEKNRRMLQSTVRINLREIVKGKFIIILTFQNASNSHVCSKR